MCVWLCDKHSDALQHVDVVLCSHSLEMTCLLSCSLSEHSGDVCCTPHIWRPVPCFKKQLQLLISMGSPAGSSFGAEQGWCKNYVHLTQNEDCAKIFGMKLGSKHPGAFRSVSVLPPVHSTSSQRSALRLPLCRKCFVWIESV